MRMLFEVVILTIFLTVLCNLAFIEWLFQFDDVVFYSVCVLTS